MNKAIRMFLNYLWQSILFWTFAMLLWAMFRFYGIESEEGITISADFRQGMQMKNILPLFALAGFLMGIFYATVEFAFERYNSKRRSIGLTIVIKTLIYLFFIILIATSMIELGTNLFGLQKNNDPGWWRHDKGFWITTLYILFTSLIFSFIRIANEKFGKGVFLKMLLGRYKKPQEEKRIFMFLDLKSSTAIAEALGHFKYSQLIQDCFYDLNDIVPKYAAEIYQYVGDEAVLSWPYHRGLANTNCVALFFAFQNVLKSRNSYYLDKYGLVPEFKAGLHGGKLMVAEVGVVKKELAFHGDVINTSARIQAECNKHNVTVLISEELKENLPVDSKYSTKSIGNLLLKGKKKELNVFTILQG
ncbi:adenylate/guanylate cyclase domain-containing protein [Ulvibacterium marinum]|uniref:Adenylate/guanylate cyclase domain-containing protein n=1 Tax=Ulvibacterium marinum TaxID=2419782 RepID=A0A3B0C6B6_9FLAO|nr:adenylate/guanylate cyclase domain-containing protein [Ulvibacterium marinum]RKN81172.1 adenylate/guanylate cyclase domain-containing protein [Ulvibacterium marinum]